LLSRRNAVHRNEIDAR